MAFVSLKLRKTMNTVNKEHLKNYLNGGPLMHYEQGQQIFLLDEMACEKAADALDAGEEISLTDNEGRIISKLKLENEGYVESPI
jgi:hypothetical protein